MVWNNEGLKFYYTAKRHWKEVYSNKDDFSDLCNKWERWEPEEKSRMNPIRTYWRKREEKKDEMMEGEPVEWWEDENVGYTENSDAEPEFYWNEDLKNGTGDNGSYEEGIMMLMPKMGDWRSKSVQITMRVGQRERKGKTRGYAYSI